MRKFEVEVTSVSQYIITIDEDNLDKDLIAEYERDIALLDTKDKIKHLAKKIGSMTVDNCNDHYEGIGYIIKDDIDCNKDYEKGITIETDYVDDCEVNIFERK